MLMLAVGQCYDLTRVPIAEELVFLWRLAGSHGRVSCVYYEGAARVIRSI